MSVSVVIVAVSATSSSISQHSTCVPDGHSPPPVVAPPRPCQTGFTDDHVTNTAADGNVRSPPKVCEQHSDRSADGTGNGCLVVTDEMVSAVEECNSIVARTSNANGICSSGRASGVDGAKASHLTRSGGLHRRLNVIVRERIVLFTKKDRSTSPKS